MTPLDQNIPYGYCHCGCGQKTKLAKKNCTLDNRRRNLRIASRSQQCMNQRRNSRNTSGFKGVSFCSDRKTKPWRTEIMVDGVSYYLGYTDTPEEGAERYAEASKRLHGDFGRTG